MKLENNNANLNGNKFYEYGIEKAAAHPRFISTSSDIAWIKLERDVKFVPNVIQPICLPLSDDGSDVADLQPVGYCYITYIVDIGYISFGPVLAFSGSKGGGQWSVRKEYLLYIVCPFVPFELILADIS